MEFDKLDQVVLFNIAIMLDLDNLLNFCNSDPRINQLICQGEAIWNFKLMKEFPDYKSHINQRGREAYELLFGLTKLKKEFKYEKSIYKLYKESTLYLSGNQITSLPPEIGNLSNLKELWLNNNQIKILPSEIGKLNQLQQLFLNNNQIKSLPSEIDNLSNLESLWINNNQIKSLPSEIGNLRRLKYLSLNNNQIEKLPPEIGNLTSLQTLYLNANQIKTLPPKIVNLANLKELRLDKSVIIPLELNYLHEIIRPIVA